MAERTSKPEWWRRNEILKKELELPTYEPPRFENGTYTHEIVPELEEKYGCTIRFQSKNTLYPGDWSVTVDGEAIFAIGRYRDENGNTVFERSSGQFIELVENSMSN